MIERITIPGAPTPRGPYSPAVRGGDYIYVSGQVGVDPVSGQLPAGGIGPETRQTLANIQKILEGCGASMAQVVRSGVYLTAASDFKPMNEVYARSSATPNPPAPPSSWPRCPCPKPRSKSTSLPTWAKALTRDFVLSRPTRLRSGL